MRLYASFCYQFNSCHLLSYNLLQNSVIFRQIHVVILHFSTPYSHFKENKLINHTGHWSVLPLIAFPLLYNDVFLVGTMNYLFGIGLSLWALATWVALRERAMILR